MSFTVLEVKEVTYKFASQTEALFENISFTLEPYEFMTLLGFNGCGKSTLAKLLNGLRLPFSGKVLVDSMSTADEKHITKLRNSIQLLGQNPSTQIVSSTVFDEVAFGPCNLGLEENEVIGRVNRALELTNLCGFEKRSPESLSGGEQQRLMLAGVLAMHPKYLILDEAFSMLDTKLAKELMALIVDLNKKGLAVLNISHSPFDLLYSDSCVVLDTKKLSKKYAKDEFFDAIELLISKGLLDQQSFEQCSSDLAKEYSLNRPIYSGKDLASKIYEKMV